MHCVSFVQCWVNLSYVPGSVFRTGRSHSSHMLGHLSYVPGSDFRTGRSHSSHVTH